MSARRFTWVDGERTIHFGPAEDAVAQLGGPGFTLLTTRRAAAAAPHIAAAAGTVHEVGRGQVHELAAGLLATVSGDRLVALGGGRVVDVTKALAAAARAGVAPGNVAPGGEVRAMAVPTTLSGAEMTAGHRQAAGVDDATPRVRATVVIFDPALAASQPVRELAASAANALGHAVEGPCTVRANPVATLAAHEAARLIGQAWASEEPDRETLALGALLAGYVIDSTGLGLHHVLAQTLVRVLGAGHGPANAVMLPHTTAALATRSDAIDAFDDVAGLARRLQELAGATSLSALGLDTARLSEAADAAAARPQLANTPPAADRDEVLRIYENAS